MIKLIGRKIFFKKLYKKCIGQLLSKYGANSLRSRINEIPYKNSEKFSLEDFTVIMCSDL